jgi:hypothetical protein
MGAKKFAGPPHREKMLPLFMAPAPAVQPPSVDTVPLEKISRRRALPLSASRRPPKEGTSSNWPGFLIWAIDLGPSTVPMVPPASVKTVPFGKMPRTLLYV